MTEFLAVVRTARNNSTIYIKLSQSFNTQSGLSATVKENKETDGAEVYMGNVRKATCGSFRRHHVHNGGVVYELLPLVTGESVLSDTGAVSRESTGTDSGGEGKVRSLLWVA